MKKLILFWEGAGQQSRSLTMAQRSNVAGSPPGEAQTLGGLTSPRPEAAAEDPDAALPASFNPLVTGPKYN